MRALVRSSLTIASAAYRESMRQPAAIVTLLAATTVIVLSPHLGVFDLGEEYKIAVDTSLAAVLLAGLFTVLFAASQTVSAELQSRTALTLLAKPVSWEAFLIGKFLGIAAAGLTTILILAVPVLVVTRLSADPVAEHSVLLEPRACQAAEVSVLEPSRSLCPGDKLRVSGPPDERMVFLLFDTQAAAGSDISNITLHLRWLGAEEAGDSSATPAKRVALHHVPDTLWSEETLTWNSKPPLGQRLAILPPPEPNRTYELPVYGRAGPTRMLALALTAPAGANAYFGGPDASPDRRIRLEIRRRVPADPARWLVILGAPGLCLALSTVLARRRTHSPYAAAAIAYAIASLTALVLLSRRIGWGGAGVPGPLPFLGLASRGWDWPILQGVCLSGMEIVLLAAIGVAIAARAGRVWTFILTLLVFVTGHMVGDWATRLAGGPPAGWKLAAVSILPNLEHFNLSDRVAHGEVLPLGLFLSAGLYMALYAVAALLVGMALIRGREVK